MGHIELRPGRAPLKKRTRLPDDAPSYPVGHRLRLESLIILHERESSAADIAEMLHEDVRVVTNHLRDLFDAGCIEFVGHKGDGNIRKAVYRAVTRPLISDDEYNKMSLGERHEINGVATQWIVAECLSSYRNNKMDNDQALCLIADALLLDVEGRIELRDLFTASWSSEPGGTLDSLQSAQEIAARAANRMAKSGEAGTTVVVTLMAFERGGASPSVQRIVRKG
jgi:DNA-binding transcriptional ArsR family regulator